MTDRHTTSSSMIAKCPAAAALYNDISAGFSLDSAREGLLH